MCCSHFMASKMISFAGFLRHLHVTGNVEDNTGGGDIRVLITRAHGLFAHRFAHLWLCSP